MLKMNTTAGLEAALGELGEIDPVMAALWRRIGTPDPRWRPPGFESLLRAIVSQQLSVQAVAAIWDRLAGLCGEVTPAAIMAHDDSALRGAGLSRSKVAFARALAAAAEDGTLDFAGLADLDDAAAIEALVAIKGIGVWTAEVYLVFSMARRDVLPAGDLALLKAAQHYLDLPARPTIDEFRVIGERWRPLRSAAARLLWHGYGGVP